MFAGLPGIGVGTLFYVLVALWMPIWEVTNVVRGRSSLARWKLIGRQLFFALGIIGSIVLADRILTWVLGWKTSSSVGPARWIHEEFGARAPDSIMAAPIMASIALLVVVLLAVQIARVVLILVRRGRIARERHRGFEAPPLPLPKMTK